MNKAVYARTERTPTKLLINYIHTDGRNSDCTCCFYTVKGLLGSCIPYKFSSKHFDIESDNAVELTSNT